MPLRVAIVGAGASGLTSVKCCLDEDLEPVCFERSDYIGGIWHFTTTDREDSCRVMRDTLTNTSKEVVAFSDFPMPREFPIYMHNTFVDRYLNMYADNFNLRKHIRVNTEVLSVRETSDHSSTGRWTVTVKDLKTGMTETSTFDGVFVCTGPYRYPYRPQFEGLDDFQGTVMHANQYKDSSDFKGKRVVVVGFGNSGADIATDLCNNADQVYFIARHGGWITSRIDRRGIPLDYSISRVLSSVVLLFHNLFDWIIAKVLNAKLDHKKYGLNPLDPPFSSNIVITDHLPIRLITGAVKMRPGVARFRSRGVEFVDGSEVSDIDAIILTTGYENVHPVLDDGVTGADKKMLYKAMYPPDRAHHTLALLYCFRLRGPVFPLVELQARLATRVLKGLVKLPTKQEMLKSIHQINAETKHRRTGNIIHVDYFPFTDGLGEMIGCKPNVWKLIVTDWRLALKIMFGPAVAYQFRLQGPGAWGGAREAIMTVEDRTYYPFNEGRTVRHSQQGKGSGIKLLVFGCILAAIIIRFII